MSVQCLATGPLAGKPCCCAQCFLIDNILFSLDKVYEAKASFCEENSGL